jgi:PAS domain S-box-containing protein
MGQPLRVLIIEDSENDAELLLRKLRQGGFEPLHARVETAEEMGAALSSGAWDIILSDYKLPRFTGLQALALFMETGLNIPFLMVSGNIGEDTAVETMKAGAHDYIMKDRLQRLVPAIRRELKDAEERRLRKQAEEELQRAFKKQRELTFIINHSPATAWLWRAVAGWPVEYVSDSVAEFGYTPDDFTSGRVTFASIIHPEDMPRVGAEVEEFTKAGRSNFNQEYRIVTGSGDIRWIDDRTWIRKDADGKVTHYQGITIDITDRKQAEEALLKKHEELEAAHVELKQAQVHVIQQEKMASIGQLAAGITHEINNPMSFITGNLGILRTYLEGITKTIAMQEEIARSHAPPEVLETLQVLRKNLKIDYILKDVGHLIDQSLEGAERVRKIVSDLKTFSRVEEEAYMIEDINAALDSTITIVWNEIKYKAELVKEFGELPLTSCNISHLNQVFMNLLVNAAQAIEKWGKITVRTWTQGDDIYVSVADTGNGIPEKDRKLIFEPFFTTKLAGKGTGLGLSISSDIVRRHNGDITVKSKVGEGTTFTVRIPITGS